MVGNIIRYWISYVEVPSFGRGWAVNYPVLKTVLELSIVADPLWHRPPLPLHSKRTTQKHDRMYRGKPPEG